jgi:hypothetical protein
MICTALSYRPLLQLLSNKHLLKVGWELEPDVKQLADMYDASLTPVESVDSAVVRRMGSAAAGDCSLEGICRTVLQRQVGEEVGVQAFAAALVYAHALAAADPVHGPPPAKADITEVFSNLPHVALFVFLKAIFAHGK